jgi:hypothetical protein
MMLLIAVAVAIAIAIAIAVAIAVAVAVAVAVEDIDYAVNRPFPRMLFSFFQFSRKSFLL